MAADVVVQAITLLASLAVLAKCAQYIIENSVLLAKYFRISEAAVGFVLVSVATSLPEFMVAIFSSSAGQGALSVGNVMGANITNLTVVLGISALVRPLIVKRKDLMEILQILLITSIIPLILIYTGNLDKFGGLLLLLIFAAYVYYISKKKVPMDTNGEKIKISRKQAMRAFLLFSASIAGLLLASSFVVNSALSISAATGMAETFIGATIVSLGTTLPELTVNLEAVRRRRYSLALGNAIGSPMTNITLVLGTVGILNPVSLNMSIFLTIMLFVLAANILVMYFMSTQNKITKKEGFILLALYALFILVTSGVQLSIRNWLPVPL